MLSRSVRRRIALGRALVRSWRPTGTRLVGLLRSMVTSFVALGVTFYILPGTQSGGPLPVLLLVVIVAVVGTLIRPALLGLTVLLGSFGLLLAGVLAQAAILAIAVSVAPDLDISSLPEIVEVSWVAAVISALVNWLLDAGGQDAFLGQVLGRVVRVSQRRQVDAPTGEPGLLVVQLDGVGYTLLRQAVVAGAGPTLSRWVRSGSHRVYRWHTGLPATTPAGQAVLLYGDRQTVPSFRWFHKPTGRLLVANRPADAHEIDTALSTGRGLLADGGVSVSNLFRGDADTNVLTMSDARLPERTTRGLATFATNSLGFLRTIVVFVGTVIEELYQARRQRRRDVRPRVHRGVTFALQRGVTTALLHDLNVAIVAEQMARDAPVVFVDFVDYDEVAHHAGPTRPESIRALDDLDRVLRFFEDVARETNRRYEIVVLSDHGQAQGTPFAQLAGRSLEAVVAELTDRDARPRDAAVDPTVRADAASQAEMWGTSNLLLASSGSGGGLSQIARRRERASAPTDDGSVTAPLVVVAGSLAHVYLPDRPGRATAERIDAVHPGLIAGLAHQQAVGLVLVRSERTGLTAFGPGGWRSLEQPGVGDGDDPVSVYGSRAAEDLRQLDTRDDVGDLVVLGRFDPDTGEVAAFEELVGSHGGLGGDQTEAFLVVPADWPPIAGEYGSAVEASGQRPPLSGADVHRALVDRLAALGLRRPDAPTPTGAEPVDAARSGGGVE